VKRWVIAESDPTLSQTLAQALHLPKSLAQVIINRGFRDAVSAERFLDPQLRQLADPFALPDMAAATDRILDAIKRKEKITIYGDYDVDGVTSSALLARVLNAAGATVTNFLPHRMDEGYGLSVDGIERCLGEHAPQLLVAVDCGTSSAREIVDLKRRGVDVIVLDHHEPPAELPECVALVNPKTVGRASVPLGSEKEHGRDARATYLASVGVSFKFAHALQKRGRERGLKWAEALDLREHLDLVAVGTVADVVSLVGENRSLVKAGLDRLPKTDKVGLRALLEVANVRDEVEPYHIGFRIGPRLNAAGRLGDAMAALELLLTGDAARAMELARMLNDHNAERQRIEEQTIEQAMAQAAERPDDRVLVLADDEWHVGVIGIVASRIAQEFYRPTVVIGRDGKGSCRSISGFSIVEALHECAPLLERFGGHEMAAGLSVKDGNIPPLRRALNEVAARRLTAEDLLPRVMIDAVARLEDLDEDFLANLDRFEPCGQDNPTPAFVVQGMRLRGAPRTIGKNHLKFFVTDGETTTEAVWWGAAGRELPAGQLEVAFHAELHEYGGRQNLRLKVKDIRPGS